ncbi:MAG: diaminopimelate decarboxylase [Candidatus Latescibacteria bacterium]|nr:diaminopimelate decarboxylase [Candidatus Latescibacterota bacterium]
MHSFIRNDKVLFVESVPLSDIAETYGTPAFVYSQETLGRHVRNIDGAFDDIDHITCYSVKANANAAILALFAESGLGADIVSGGELFRALRAGIPAERIVFSGVGKTAGEIGYALDEGILMFNVESESELTVIDRIAGEKGVRAPISFRINPDVDPKTHPYISTGLKKNKFGIPHGDALRLYKRAAGLDNIDVVGIDAHIGSQLTDVSPYREEAERLAELIENIRGSGSGIDIDVVDIGGGLGINYEEEFPPDPAEWAEMVVPVMKDLGCRLIIEPGRSIVGNAGVLLTRVLYVKHSGDKTFVVVDAAMNDLARPSLYGSYHAILPVVESSGKIAAVDVVGPICESSDFLAKNRDMELPEEGDLLAVMSAGAYGMAMSSNYNSRLRAAEVMVDGKETRLAARRETFEDIVEREKV